MQSGLGVYREEHSLPDLKLLVSEVIFLFCDQDHPES